jgi:enoyl-CoA hydratase
MSWTLKKQTPQVAVLLMDRADKLNAQNRTALQQLDELLSEVERDRECRAVILKSAGDRVFIAGADISEMAELGPREAREFALLGQKVVRHLETIPQPVIGLIQGAALGGGCELAMGCTFLIATESAVFGQPETALGLIAGWGGTQRLLHRVGAYHAREMLIAGRRINAQEALTWGLVNEVVPAGQQDKAAERLALEICKQSPLAVAQTKRVLALTESLPLESGLALEAESFGLMFGTLDMKEGTRAFLDKRKPSWYPGSR